MRSLGFSSERSGFRRSRPPKFQRLCHRSLGLRWRGTAASISVFAWASHVIGERGKLTYCRCAVALFLLVRYYSQMQRPLPRSVSGDSQPACLPLDQASLSVCGPSIPGRVSALHNASRFTTWRRSSTTDLCYIKPILALHMHGD